MTTCELERSINSIARSTSTGGHRTNRGRVHDVLDRYVFTSFNGMTEGLQYATTTNGPIVHRVGSHPPRMRRHNHYKSLLLNDTEKRGHFRWYKI